MKYHLDFKGGISVKNNISHWIYKLSLNLNIIKLITVILLLTNLVSCNDDRIINSNSNILKTNNKVNNITKSVIKYDPATWRIENAPAKITPQNSSMEMILITQNVKLALYVNITNGVVGLLDKQYDKFYFSSPTDTVDTDTIDFTFKEKVLSLLVVDTVDEIGNKQRLYSTTDSALKGGMKLKKLKNTLLATFEFKEQGISIPAEFSLNDDYLQVKIDPKQVVEKSKTKIYSITVMQYFGSIKGDENGYLFVPDGSGAIISANSKKVGTYYENILGYEDVLEKESVKSYQEKTLLPAFGIKNGEFGILGIIDSAYEKCGIGAENSTPMIQLNSVYPIWKIRTLVDISLPAKNWVSKTVAVLEKNAAFDVPFSARYYPLEKNKNEYTNMALRYREYLLNEKNATNLADNEVYDGYIDLYGYVKKPKSIMGWPVVIDQPLTNISQAKEIISDFTNRNLKLGIKYNGWIKDGYLYKIPQKANISSVVGSKSELEDLSKFAKANNFTLFPTVDPITVFKNGNGFDQFNDAAKTVNNIAYVEYSYPINLQYKNYEYPQARLLSPNKIISFTNIFMNSYNKMNIGAISFDGLGNRAYSDYGSNSCSRYQAVMNIAKTIQDAGKSNEIMLSAAAAFAIGYTKHSIAAPYESSNYMISEKSVPFYQIALRGLINISSPSINLESDPRKIILKCFETGTLPMFSFIGNDVTLLNGSSLNNLYAADYLKWKDYTIDTMDSFREFNKMIKSKKIIRHEQLENKVFKTTFEGQVVIIVNYNNETVSVDGQQIEAMNYKIL